MGQTYFKNLSIYLVASQDIGSATGAIALNVFKSMKT